MSNRYTKNWTHVILQRSTLESLKSFVRKLEKQRVEGRNLLGNPDRGISIDVAVAELLARDARHFARMRRSRARKAQQSKNGTRTASDGVINNGPTELNQ